MLSDIISSTIKSTSNKTLQSADYQLSLCHCHITCSSTAQCMLSISNNNNACTLLHEFHFTTNAGTALSVTERKTENKLQTSNINKDLKATGTTVPCNIIFVHTVNLITNRCLSRQQLSCHIGTGQPSISVTNDKKIAWLVKCGSPYTAIV